MPAKYTKPPLVEALCEFRFESHTPWDATVPGLVYGELSDDFPLKETDLGLEFSLQQESHGLSQEVRKVQRAVFMSSDKDTRVQIAPNTLVVNKLQPYEGWASFHPLIIRVVGAYESYSNPDSIASIVLRYINKLAIPMTEGTLDKHLDFYPHAWAGQPVLGQPFMVGLRTAPDSGQGQLKVELTSGPPAESEYPLTLDLEYRLGTPSLPLRDVGTWLDGAHTEIESAFESCIKLPLKRTFE